MVRKGPLLRTLSFSNLFKNPNPIPSFFTFAQSIKMKSRKPESFIKQPEYPGGNKAMDDFIRQNLRYPEEAMQNRIEGTVAVEIEIDVYGKVTGAKVKHKIGYGCDEEAIRLVNLLQFDKKKYRGLYVVFHRTVNIHFRLNNSGNQPQVAYQYKEKKDGKTYTYTINSGQS